MSERVLLIDDEEQFRSSVKIALKRKGINVDTAVDGADGLNSLVFSKSSGCKYDLVILDIMMPKVSGIDILEYMIQEYPKVPVIIVTGFMDYDLKFFCSAIKDLIVLEKPFCQNILVQEVMHFLEKKPAGEENEIL